MQMRQYEDWQPADAQQQFVPNQNIPQYPAHQPLIPLPKSQELSPDPKLVELHLA
jgi:hypothetical protein